jgi:uncharacterized protein YjbI with pentapeptide repeats
MTNGEFLDESQKDFSSINLEGIDLQGVDLEGAKLEEANLELDSIVPMKFSPLSENYLKYLLRGIE